ncbi:lysine decarboxylase [Proteiniborus sp. DW1]|uniref:aminotransferase class I/II-fold pyridoxal phosphate-dependent enzyme n=1 Tax=Proteiniborus sp. DW1 TaxID=1889883 RepID=UPI00092DF35E|nr:aminotransferase class I/II-fold pyridoxal phosphate-dependent enzyme [Proteiniborus sp. DW1]SCG82113.1 lysine decarboxylase [Proteiniborus sp. DW1]
MDKIKHEAAPIHDALIDYRNTKIVSFDVPGHKQGKGNTMLKNFLGDKCLSVDVNSMKPLDNLTHPTSVIKEAEELAADAFKCDKAFFMVNGTSSAVQTMIMSACKEGEKIIMPRNVHKSAINAVILNGAIPVYVSPGINKELGIPLGMSVKDVEKAIIENPDAKAVFVNNPTYYGICSDLKSIIELAHKHNMLVLADEAHGTHFYFGENLPPAAMHLGADMAAVSVHKTGGSLTQSSLLLANTERINPGYIRTIINLTQTTSASYLLLSSLDIARKNLALNGKEIFARVLELSEYARKEINSVGGYYAFSEEIINGDSTYAFDKTKLSVNTLNIGLAGIEVYDMLRDDYSIQLEFGDLANFLAIISVGDSYFAIERLVSALAEIKRTNKKDKSNMIEHEYITPVVKISPKTAFYANKKKVKLSESIGEISGESIMCYPPGIPILAPGEMITRESVDYILYSKEKGCLVTGMEDMKLGYINVLDI